MTRFRTMVATLIVATGLTGCDGSGGLTEDTGICSARPATFGSSGELTAYPFISTRISGVDLRLLSVNFVAVPPAGEFLPVVRVLAEVENREPSRICAAAFDVSMGGFTDGAALHGPQYFLPGVGVAFPCLEPGERGVIYASLFEATEEDLLNATTLRISLSNGPFSGMGEELYRLTSLSDQRIVPVDGGFQLVQTVTADRDVLNYFQDVYAVDARGLLIADLDVPSFGPSSGGAALQAGMPEELESDVVDCEFVDFFVAGENYFEP